MPTHPSALCLLDYQRALCEPGEHCLAPPLADQAVARGVVDVAARVLAAARQAEDVFVVHVRLAFDRSYELRTNRTPRFDRYPNERLLLRDSPGAEIMPALAPQEHEPLVTKGGVDPFIGTPMLEMLVGHGVRQLHLGGVATNLVVESAARHASDSGFAVAVAEDMCASFSPEMHDLARNQTLPLFADVTTGDALVESMKGR